jgi:hypothetical protein
MPADESYYVYVFLAFACLVGVCASGVLVNRYFRIENKRPIDHLAALFSVAAACLVVAAIVAGHVYYILLS